MTEADEDQYDHDLVELFSILERIDLPQFLIDLRSNQPETFELIRLLMEKERNGRTG